MIVNELHSYVYIIIPKFLSFDKKFEGKIFKVKQKSQNSQKLEPLKFPGYTVYNIPTYVTPCLEGNPRYPNIYLAQTAPKTWGGQY